MTTSKSKYKISVILVTYNHESYIDDAMESLVMQELNMPVEVIVADDGSSDKTLKKINSYDKKNAFLKFRYLKNEKNIGVTKNYQRAIAECSGEYVCILEGDDYWIHINKILTQADFLDNYKKVDLVANNFFIKDSISKKFYLHKYFSDEFTLLSSEMLINENIIGNFSSCMYRRSALINLPPEVFNITSYDWIINILIAMNGLVAFNYKPISVYRLHSGGHWSSLKSIEKLTLQLKLISSYNKITNYSFSDDFRIVTNRLKRQITLAKMKNIYILCLIIKYSPKNIKQALRKFV